jgi:hypothetical protein
VIEREFGVSPEQMTCELYEKVPKATIYDISTTQKALGWQPIHAWTSVLSAVLNSLAE